MAAVLLILSLWLPNSYSATTATGMWYECDYPDVSWSDGLVLLHVIHRHGGRTRDERTYPNDPYINETFYPYGYAQLTNKGKQTMYRVGKELRARYDSFLGDLYTVNLIEPQTTETNRTKMSLLLNMAGLFPPVPPLVWNSELNWQPIPYNSADEHVLGDSKYFCPKVKKLLAEYLSKDGKELFKNDLDLYEYCSSHSGWNITTPEDIYRLFKVLNTEEEFGLKLPEWTKPIWKAPIYKAAVKRFTVRTGTTELKRLSGGWFLKEIIENTFKKIEGTLKPPERKLFLYSAHETNLGIILGTLGLFDNEIPKYGSQVLFEVRLIDGIYGFEIYHFSLRGGDDPKLLTLPGCDSFCPVDEFVELLKDVLPKDFSECGQ